MDGVSVDMQPSSSAYSTAQRCLPAHQNTIWLPLKVIFSEYNHTQSNAQTSYITQTVNSRWLYFPLTENGLQPIYNFTLSHQLKKAVSTLKFSRTMGEALHELLVLTDWREREGCLSNVGLPEWPFVRKYLCETVVMLIER